MDNAFIVHYLRKLSKKYPNTHHKYFALSNAADSFELRGKESYDSETTEAELKKMKYVGPFISKLVVDLINDRLEDDYKLDESNLLIDNKVFHDIAKKIGERFHIFQLSELRSRVRSDKDLLNELSDEHLDHINLTRTEYWSDLINQIADGSNIHIAGSLRRGKITIKDFDLVSTYSYDQLREALKVASEKIGCDILIINKGKKRVRILVTKPDGSNIEGDVRLVPEDSLFSALLYFTGSKNLNIRMRGIAKSKGFQLNEYGIKKDGELIKFNSEESIFEFLGMDYIDPINR